MESLRLDEIAQHIHGSAGHDPDLSGHDRRNTHLRDLLGEVGRVYVPYMIGNAKAIARGAKQVACEVDGQPWVQESFVYQAKCLGWLRKAYSALNETARRRVDRLLLGTGCEPLFAPL